MMRRKFDCEKGGLLLERSSTMTRKFDYERGRLFLERQFYDDKKVVF